MARSRRAQTRGRRRNGRPIVRRRGQMNRSRVTNAPPRLSITANTRRLVIPYGVDVSTHSTTIKLTHKNIFEYGPNVGLSYEFSEVKVHRIRVFWQSDNGTGDKGSTILVVGDNGENNIKEDTPFHELMSYPGSMVRKTWQNISAVWFPTEPTDRDWYGVGSSNTILSVYMRHSVEGSGPNPTPSSLNGRLMMLCSVSMRGRNTARCRAAQAALEYCDRVGVQLDIQNANCASRYHDGVDENPPSTSSTLSRACEGFELLGLEPPRQ